MKTVTLTKIDHVATGDTMARLRRSTRMTMREMARRLGISAPYLCDLEHGRRNWSVGWVTAYVAELLFAPTTKEVKEREEE